MAHAPGTLPQTLVRGLRLTPGGITLAGKAEVDNVYAQRVDIQWEVTRFAYADGSVQWHRLYESANAPQNGSRTESLLSFQVDAADNVYAAGARSTASAGPELVLIKYSGVGDTQFIKPFPTADQKLDIMEQASQLTGDGRPAFLSPINGGAQAVIVTFDNPAVKAASTTPPFANIATRLKVEAGDNGAIGGFIIKGTAGTTKNVLIRGLGPSLAQYGVTGVLANPYLELHDGSGALIVANDDWQSAANASQIPAGFTEKIDPKDSIINRTISVGSDGTASYTAVLKGVNNATGIALVEVYDLDDAATSQSQLANIATRDSCRLVTTPSSPG